MHAALMDTLHDPTVRDLAWVIGAPGLLDAAAYAGRVVDDAWCRTQLQACLPWLAELDTEPASLHDFIAARSTRRLGLYFESLIAFWLAHLPDTQLISKNLQAQDGSRTVGEYDFLFRDANADVCHWEVAVKFYLQATPLPEQRAFIGPGARDRLDLKLDRVFTHQLELSQTSAGRAALPPGIAPSKVQAFIKGYLFYPLRHSGEFSLPDTAVPGISGAHPCGWWMRHPVAALPQGSAESRWMILPRLHWLAPLHLDANESVMSNSEMCAAIDQHFAASSAALQLAELQQAAGHGWRETARGFVVHGAWPQPDLTARPPAGQT